MLLRDSIKVDKAVVGEMAWKVSHAMTQPIELVIDSLDVFLSESLPSEAKEPPVADVAEESVNGQAQLRKIVDCVTVAIQLVRIFGTIKEPLRKREVTLAVEMHNVAVRSTDMICWESVIWLGQPSKSPFNSSKW